ncbi:Thioredoxin-like 3-3 [Linum grandiflorum]
MDATEGDGKKASEGIDMAANRHGNLRKASTDETHLQILRHITSSRAPAVINYGASWYNFLLLFSSFHFQLVLVAANYARKVFDHLPLRPKRWKVFGRRYSCSSCNRILPAFLRLSNDFPKLSFVYADIDECPETTHQIRFTPSFHFYRDGEKVDEMIGIGDERLHDRLWLHSD